VCSSDLEVVRAGGHPVLRVRIPETEEALVRLGKDEQISYRYPCHKKDFQIANGLISIWAEDNTKAMTSVPPAKQALVSKAKKPLLDTMLKRSSLKGTDKFRWVGTQYPCQASAQDAEMSLGEYENFVFKAGLLHLPDPAKAWRKIGTAQQRMCDFLDKAKEIRFISGKTDLRLGIEGRKWINCDGRNNFPDGEVFTGPIETATEGVVHYSFPAVFNGQEVEGVRLQFKAGKCVDASASKGEAFLHKMIDMDKGAKTLGEIAIGTNYAITDYTKNTLFDEKIGGTFHAAVGAGYPEQALPYLDEVLRRNKKNFKAQLAVGQIHLEAERPAEAKPHLEAALALNADSPEVWNNLGGLDMAAGDPRSAAVKFEKAIALDPNASFALVNAGQAWARAGDAAKAEQRFRRALEVAPGDAEAADQIGRAHV